MILQVEHIAKDFGSGALFRDVTFRIKSRDRVALVGVNGAGKTTLLNIIAGKEFADSGEVIFAKGVEVGYLVEHVINSTIVDTQYKSGRAGSTTNATAKQYPGYTTGSIAKATINSENSTVVHRCAHES